MKIIGMQRCWVLALALAGCGSQRDEVPGSIAPGSIEAVSRQIPCSGNTDDGGIAGLSLVPCMIGGVAEVPLITPPQLISFYVFPRKSRDGLCYREGVWIHRVITPFSWGIDDVRHDDRLRLSALRSDDVVDQARSTTTDGGASAASQPAEPPPTLPWREQAAAQGQTRTTVIYPNSGTAVSTVAPSNQVPSYVGANGSVNMQEVQHAMQEAQQRVRELQQARAQTGTSTLSPSQSPPPSSAVDGSQPVHDVPAGGP
jgi:hypothetical protein